MMAANTKIQWADHTFNPWIGCAKVASGCANCYAAAQAGRHHVTWGVNGTRRRTAASTWKQVERWNRQAACFKTFDCNAGDHSDCCPQSRRPRVFPSLCDPFEDWPGVVLGPVGAGWKIGDVRRDFFALIDRCQNLDFLLLTKRPENIRRMWPDPDEFVIGGSASLLRENVWLLFSASDQESLDDGLPHLLACQDLAPVLGLSLEPLVGPIDLAFAGTCPKSLGLGYSSICDHVDWVIVGGESGPRARPCNVEWIRSIVEQCRAAKVPCFVKQLGANIVTRNDMVEDEFNSKETGWPDPPVEYDIHGFAENYQGADCRIQLRDPKGGDPSEWPEDLRVRELPHGPH